MDTTMVQRLRMPRALMMMAIAAVMMLVLAACGPTLNTKLTIDDKGAGSRVISLVITQSDMESIPGGAGVIDETIKANVPGEITYHGMSSGADGATVYNFEITFTDPADYEAKAQKVLDAGGVDKQASVTLTLPKKPFAEGARIDENFTSADLLAWAANALEAKLGSDTVSASDFSGSGEVTVALPGQDEITDQLEPIDAGEASQHGFTAIAVKTGGIGSGDALTRTITYTLPADSYARSPKDYDAWIDSVTPDGGKAEKSTDDNGDTQWVLTLPEGDAQAISAQTDTALNTSGTSLEVTTEPDSENPLRSTTYVTDTLTCSTICTDSGVIRAEHDVPEGWEHLTESGVDSDTGKSTVTYSHMVLVQDFRATTTIGEVGGGEVAYAYTFSKEDDAKMGKDIAAWVKGDSRAADPKRTEDGDTVTYTMTFSGTAEQLAGDVGEYIGADGPYGTGTITKSGESMFTTTSRFHTSFAAPRQLSENPPAASTWTVKLPDGYEAQPGTVSSDPKGKTSAKGSSVSITTTEATSSAPSVTGEAESRNWVGVIALIVLLVFALAIVFAIIALVRRAKRRSAQAAPHPAPNGAQFAGAPMAAAGVQGPTGSHAAPPAASGMSAPSA
ncbi:hypothetical protein, partial [Helcobacillus massiliensis]